MKYIITERQYGLLTEDRNERILKLVDMIINRNKPEEVSEIRYQFDEPDEHYNVYKLQITFVITETTDFLKPPRNHVQKFRLDEKLFGWTMKIIKEIQDYLGISVMMNGREMVFEL